MTTALRPYSAYKDSGIEWLGDVPSHWESRRAKYIFRPVDIRTASGDEELLSVSETDGVVPRRDKTVTMFMAESYVGHKLCWPGDLVINSLWAWKRGLGVSKYHGIVSSAYGVYRLQRPQDHETGYLHRALRSNVYDRELRVRSKGVWTSRLQLTDDAFLDMRLVLPPLDEQRAIADFLDVMDARISRFIAAKRRLIALLEEKRQAVINQAVTRGLDPDVPLKDSGVDWLGEIPAHWDITPMNRLVREIEQGWSPVASNDVDDQDENRWSVITLSAVKKGIFDPYANKPLHRDLVPQPRLRIQIGDFLLTRANTRNLVGDVAIVESLPCNLILCDLVYRLRFFDGRVEPPFLKWLLLSRVGRFQIERAARASNETMVKINHSLIRSWQIPLPPHREQLRIVDYVEYESERINSIIARAHREVELIEEYRTRLISDVVTGKLDVHSVQQSRSEG